MVVGSIHGNEPAGKAVIARLRRAHPPRGTALWLIDDANPDGAAAGTRHNAHGVDLNRNFPYRWQPAGRRLRVRVPAPASEPETQAMQRFVERERPRVTRLVPPGAAHGRPAAPATRASSASTRALSGLPRTRAAALPRHGQLAGRTRRFPGDTAFVVELPGRAAAAPPACAATRAPC